MPWLDFEARALAHFNMSRENITLGYRLNMDGRGLSHLTCEGHWDAALIRVREKCLSAQTRAVMMELKNVVSTYSLGSKMNTLTFFPRGKSCPRRMRAPRGRGRGRGGRGKRNVPAPRMSPLYPQTTTSRLNTSASLNCRGTCGARNARRGVLGRTAGLSQHRKILWEDIARLTTRK